MKSIDSGLLMGNRDRAPKPPPNGERSALGGWVRVGLLAWVLVGTGAQMMGAKGVKGVNCPCSFKPQGNRCLDVLPWATLRRIVPMGRKRLPRVRTSESSGKGNVEPPSGCGGDDKGENRDIPQNPQG